ncbi:hypothetical protein FVE85_4868 [Porphyridium purpureum]|uniref:Fe2OG dioxygenase domain-containing protein n=1 Tax=Porphyridium purpureum TaxID=35688 RepID=A0A5J4YQD4_PORPP|nr:hypothetical protein FVE85_4868 [Porphyridium purpureum]|eukprot:POR6180..scf236_6
MAFVSAVQVDAVGLRDLGARQVAAQWRVLPKRRAQNALRVPCMDAARASGMSLREVGIDRVHDALKRIGLGLNRDIDLDAPPYTNARVLHLETPSNADLILSFEEFLSPDECEFIIEEATRQHDKPGAEADLYLNYRVNRELDAGGYSSEADALSSDEELSSAELETSAGSGFRVQLNHELVKQVVVPKLMRLFGMEERAADFSECLSVKPDPRTLVIRDCTCVLYKLAEGVAPHVDGKDATLLVYLCDGPEQGGHTVFIDQALSVPPTRGTALLYMSKTQLPHYSQRVGEGTKWIMQLLIDHRVRHAGPYFDRRTGEVFTN